MAAITRANWATPLASTWVQQLVGMTFLEDSHLLQLFQTASVNASGFFNQNWSSGSTASYVGASLTASAAAGIIDVPLTKQMGSILGVEQWSNTVTGNGFSVAQQQINARRIVMAGISRKLVEGFLGSDTGASNGTLQGLDYIVDTYGLGYGQQVVDTASDYSKLLANVDQAVEACTAPGYPVIFTAPKGRSAFKAAMRAGATGGTLNYLTLENFTGAKFLSYDGIPIVVTDAITAASDETTIYVAKFGPEAIELVVPEAGLFDVDPTVSTINSRLLARNLTLSCQFWHHSPRACARVESQDYTAP